ncbi:MAG: hypothetical protein R3E96_03610 [Planctomycetota bacterium]
MQSVVVNVETYWENASPEEIETDVIDAQEKVLATYRAWFR